MTKVFEFIHIDAANWTEKCEEWAREGTEFHLYGVTTEQFDFCKELCSRHDYLFRYEFRQGLSVAVFFPASDRIG